MEIFNTSDTYKFLIDDSFGVKATDIVSTSNPGFSSLSAVEQNRLVDDAVDYIWKESSARYASNVQGDGRAFIFSPRDNATAEIAEFPNLVRNAGVTSLEGIPHSTLQTSVESYGVSSIFDNFTAMSENRISSGEVRISGDNITFNPDFYSFRETSGAWSDMQFTRAIVPASALSTWTAAEIAGFGNDVKVLGILGTAVAIGATAYNAYGYYQDGRYFEAGREIAVGVGGLDIGAGGFEAGVLAGVATTSAFGIAASPLVLMGADVISAAAVGYFGTQAITWTVEQVRVA